MTTALQILNAAQKHIVDFANSEGISLSDHFKTVDEFKNFVFAMCFKVLRESGMETGKAFDTLLGDGAFQKLFDDVWEGSQCNAIKSTN